jgi:hypothetical protein
MNAVYSLFRVAKGQVAVPSSEDGAGGQAPESVSMAERFKRAFSQEGVRVHFVGAWCVITCDLGY